MSMASGYKQTLLSDSFIISLCEGPSGRISSTLSLILNPKQKKSNTTLNYKLSIWIGALEFGSFLFHKDPSDSDKCKFDAGRVKILWSPLGDHLCIVFENEIIFIDIIYKLNGASNICLQEALHWLDHDTSYSDSIVAQVKLVKRVNESTTATGVTINMGRFLAIGGQNGRLLKYYWDGDFISEISFTNIHVVLPVTSLVTSQLEHVSIVEERSENSKLSTNPKNISSKLDDIEGNNSLYIESWSERTCTLAARYHDGSLLLILLVGSKCFATSRFHPVLLSKQSQYADLTHPNRDGFGKQFFSVVMNSVELSQRKNAQGLQASHTNRQSVQLSQPLESVSKLVHCQLIDSPIACEPDNLLLVCLVYTRHFPSEFMTPRTAAFYGPSGGVATATEPGVDTFIDLSHPHTLSVVIIRAHYHSKESTQVESGSVISDGKVKSNGRPRGVHSNIDLTVTSICPIRDLVHANKATVGAPNERRMDGRGPVTFEILHLPQELRLLLLVDGTLTCRSLPDLSNIYFIIDTTVISPTPSFYGSSTSRYHFAVTHGALVISSSQKYLPEHLSDAGQEHQLKIKPVLPKYESTISNVQLITSCHGPLSTQASSVLLSLDDSPSLYVHYIHDLPIGPPTLRQGSEDPRELRESVDKYMSLDWDETPRDIMLTSDSLDYTYKTSHSMHVSTAHRTQKIQDSFGDFLSVKLPFRLVSALRAYSARLGTDGRAQPGYAEPTLQTGLIVAQSVLGENKHMQSQYLAVAVGGPSIPPSHNHSAIAAASPHTTTEISTIWLHNCHTRRWREVYLDISSDMRHDKCYGRVQLIVELRMEDMINTPISAITQNDSFREFFHGTLCGHLSSIAGPLQAVIGLSWYDDHTLIAICMRRSRYCLEVFSRAATRASLQSGSPRPNVHKIYPLPIGYRPTFLDLAFLPCPTSPEWTYDAATGVSPRVDSSRAPFSPAPGSETPNSSTWRSPPGAKPGRRFSGASNMFSMAGSSVHGQAKKNLIPLRNRAVVVIGDGKVFSAFHIQAYASPHDEIMSRKLDAEDYDMSTLWECDLEAIAFKQRPLSSSISASVRTLKTPIRSVVAAPVPESTLLSKQTAKVTPVLASGKTDLCLLILDQDGTVWQLFPGVERLVPLSVRPFIAIERFPLHDLLSNSYSSINITDLNNSMTRNSIFGYIFKSPSSTETPKASELWISSTCTTSSHFCIPITALVTDEMPFGSFYSGTVTSACSRLRYLPLSTNHTNIDGASATARDQIVEKSFQAIIASPIGNQAITPYNLHVQVFESCLQQLVSHVLTSGLKNQNLIPEIDVNRVRHILESIVISVDESSLSFIKMTNYLELYCKDLVYDICATRVSGPSYSKAGIEFRLITSFLYHHNKPLFFELIGLLGRKLEPDISSRLFPLYIYYDLTNLASRELSNQLVLSSLDLYEKCLMSQDFYHASRLLTLACDHVGGSENIVTLCNSLILSMELLYESMRRGLLPLALECIDFCHRLEEMLQCLTQDPLRVRHSLRFARLPSSQEDGSFYTPLFINFDYNSTDMVVAAAPTSIPSPRMSIGSQLQSSNDHQRYNNQAAVGITGGLFSALALVSPTLTYYLGGGFIWAISRTIGAFIPATSVTGRRFAANKIDISKYANSKEGVIMPHKYNAFAGVFVATHGVDPSTAMNTLGSSDAGFARFDYPLRMLVLLCKDMITHGKLHSATSMLSSSHSMSQLTRAALLQEIYRSLLSQSTNPSSTPVLSSVSLDGKPEGGVVSASFHRLHAILKSLDIHKLVLESTLRELLPKSCAHSWLLGKYVVEFDQTVGCRGINSVESLSTTLTTATALDLPIKDTSTRLYSQVTKLSHITTQVLETVIGKVSASTIEPDTHALVGHIELPPSFCSSPIVTSRRAHSERHSELRSESRVTTRADDDTEDDMSQWLATLQPGLIVFYFYNALLALLMGGKIDTASLLLVLIFKKYELAARLLISSFIITSTKEQRESIIHQRLSIISPTKPTKKSASKSVTVASVDSSSVSEPSPASESESELLQYASGVFLSVLKELFHTLWFDQKPHPPLPETSPVFTALVGQLTNSLLTTRSINEFSTAQVAGKKLDATVNEFRQKWFP